MLLNWQPTPIITGEDNIHSLLGMNTSSFISALISVDVIRSPGFPWHGVLRGLWGKSIDRPRDILTHKLSTKPL